MKSYKEKWRQLLAGYTVPDADRAASAGVPIPRLPKKVSVAGGTLRWKNSVAQQIFNVDLPITVQTLAIAAGAGSGTIVLGDTSIPSFASRFGSTFYEYCVVGGRINVNITSAANAQGVVSVYVDEKSNTPTAAKALASPHLEIPIVVTPDGRSYAIEWKAQDYDDLLWNAIGTSFAAAYCNAITSSSFGTTGTTTAQLVFTGTLAVCFRGIRG